MDIIHLDPKHFIHIVFLKHLVMLMVRLMTSNEMLIMNRWIKIHQEGTIVIFDQNILLNENSLGLYLISHFLVTIRKIMTCHSLRSDIVISVPRIILMESEILFEVHVT